jgi:NAD-specific glutamate dehydrogenase
MICIVQFSWLNLVLWKYITEVCVCVCVCVRERERERERAHAPAHVHVLKTWKMSFQIRVYQKHELKQNEISIMSCKTEIKILIFDWMGQKKQINTITQTLKRTLSLSVHKRSISTEWLPWLTKPVLTFAGRARCVVHTTDPYGC